VRGGWPLWPVRRDQPVPAGSVSAAAGGQGLLEVVRTWVWRGARAEPAVACVRSVRRLAWWGVGEGWVRRLAWWGAGDCRVRWYACGRRVGWCGGVRASVGCGGRRAVCTAAGVAGGGGVLGEVTGVEGREGVSGAVVGVRAVRGLVSWGAGEWWV